MGTNNDSNSYSTTFPPSSSRASYTTHDYTLNVYENSFLILYEVMCTVLTILLNAYLVYTILFKLKLNKNCVFIPMITASVLGLFHGLGCNLIMTISLIQGDWVGSMEWCGAAANIHKYIVYSIIYCQVVVSLEAAYLISHPHGYSRFSSKARLSAILATFIAVFLNFPITVCQFFFLKPSDILNKYPNFYTITVEGTYFYFDEYLKICYRWFFSKTLDYQIIVYFIHTCNLLAVALIIFSYAVIIRTVLKMRGKQKLQHQTSRDQEVKRAERQGKQNKKIALMTLMTTTCVLAPWFLSMVISLLLAIVEYKKLLVEPLGMQRATSVLRVNQYLYYIVTWIFPIMTIMANSALSRATRDMLVNLTTFELSSVANSMARFNVNNKQSNSQIHL